MEDTNIIIHKAVEGYILDVNSPRDKVLDAVSKVPHVFLTLADLVTYLTTNVLVDTTAPVDDTDESEATDSAPTEEESADTAEAA